MTDAVNTANAKGGVVDTSFQDGLRETRATADMIVYVFALVATAEAN
ncbi:MAG: hypothetical protein AAF724_10435 [Pseudomonadota bacterium]